MKKLYEEEYIPEKEPVLVHYQQGNTKGTYAYAHMHKHIEMLYCRDGNFDIILDNKKYTFGKGDFVVINSMENHTIHSTDETGGSYICMRVLPEVLYFLNDTQYDYKYVMPFILSSFQHKRVFKKEELENSIVPFAMENALKETENREFGYELSLKSEAVKIILWVVRNCNIKEESTNVEVVEKIQNLLFYIEQNCNGEITASDGAYFCGMSYSYFSRVFKKLMKRSFTEYVNYVRVLKAERFLGTTDKSVTEIAIQCGFSSSNYFIKIFKKIKGFTPYQLRKEL